MAITVTADEGLLQLLREVDQNITTMMRDVRLMKEACFFP